MGRRMILRMGMLLAALACGCAGDGSGLDETGAAAGGNPVLARLQDEIFGPICAQSGSCHAGSSAQRGLRLDSALNSFNNLVAVSSVGRADLLRVVPNDLENSYLVWKIEGRQGIVLGPMPPGGSLPPDQIASIRQWIAAGAPGP